VGCARGCSNGRLAIGALYDQWTSTHGDLEAIRRDLADVELSAFVPDFTDVYRLRRPKALEKLLHRLRWLVPAREPVPRSRVNRAYLLSRLYAYRDEHGKPVSANTLRRVHSAWSVFFDYLTERGVFEDNPMLRVKAPKPTESPVKWYELATVKRLIGGAPTPELRAAFALAYGGALELGGAIVPLRREQVHDATQEVHAAGTKAHRRNRVVRIDSWAWPYIADIVRDKLPSAYLFPDAWREDETRLTRAHGRAVKEMTLAPALSLHRARHHWAVTHLRAGVPVAVVQAQLGHSAPMLTLKTYGAFIPTGDDRERWAEVVEQDQARRQKAPRHSAVGSAIGAVNEKSRAGKRHLS